MSSGTIRRRRLFLLDALDAWNFIAKDSESRADDFALKLEDRAQIFADNPFLGVARFPKLPNVRLFTFRQYIVIYEPISDGSGIDLVRLIHAARDYQRFFED